MSSELMPVFATLIFVILIFFCTIVNVPLERYEIFTLIIDHDLALPAIWLHPGRDQGLMLIQIECIIVSCCSYSLCLLVASFSHKHLLFVWYLCAFVNNFLLILLECYQTLRAKIGYLHLNTHS